MIAWCEPPGGSMPAGFWACDGTTVNDPDSPFNGRPTPDLTNQFIMGSGAGVATGATGGDNGFTLNGYQSPQLVSSPTTASSADNLPPTIIMRQGVSSSDRYTLTDDGDSYNDGNHHHDIAAGAFTVPAPGWTALAYIMRIK